MATAQNSSDQAPEDEYWLQADRAWFARHKKRQFRLRKAERGEFGAHPERAIAHAEMAPAINRAEAALWDAAEPGMVVVTLVMQAGPGFRVRKPFVLPEALLQWARLHAGDDHLSTLWHDGWLPLEGFTA